MGKHFLGRGLVAGLVGLTISASAGAATIEVIPSIAPNAFGSPSWTQYQDNAVNAIAAGSTTLGSGASQYDALANNSTINVKDIVATGFESWRGVADPNTPQYSGEYGNRLHFGVKIDGQGTQFSISQLGFVATSTDANNALGFSYNPGDYDYSDGWVGHLKGSDGVLWTNDDVLITSGANTQLVDGIASRGSGNALAVYSTDPGATNQDKIDNVYSITPWPQDTQVFFTGEYMLGGDTGSATLDVVPEPTGLALIGLAGIGLLRRKRKSA